MGSSCSCASSTIDHIRLTLRKEDVRARARAKSSASQVTTRLGLDKTSFTIPLTDQEVMLLMSSWELVRQDIAGNGQKMFCKMFESSPEVKAYFEKFSGISYGSSLWRSDVLQIHGMAVMTGVDEILCSMDDADVVLELVIEQGQSHAYFGNLTEQIFWAIEKPFLETVKEALKNRYKGQLKKIYEKTIRFLIEMFALGFQKGRKAQKKGNGVLGWTLPSVSNMARSSVSISTAMSPMTGNKVLTNSLQV